MFKNYTNISSSIKRNKPNVNARNGGFSSIQKNILIAYIINQDGMLEKGIKSRTVIIMLILFSMSLLGYLPEAKAYTSVADAGSGRGIITCPRGESHEGPIAFEARSTGSTLTGDWDISTPSSSGDVFKSGIINGGIISPSGHFTLTGKEVSDDICGNGIGGSSITIKIVGQCVQGNVLTTVKFKASNGEKANFPSSPTCS